MVAQGQSLPSRSSQHSRRGRGAASPLDALRHLAASQAQHLRQRGDEYLDQRKKHAVQNISDVGAAVRRAAEKLQDSRSGALAGYVETAAAGIDGIAKYIEQQDVAEMMEKVAHLARRQPALVLGALFVAGFTAGRFSKATSPARAAAAVRRPRNPK